MFNADELRAALDELASVLVERGEAGRIVVLGGAAIALAYVPGRERTRDVDALVNPEDRVFAAAEEVAQRRGYPPDWLQNNVKIFVPHHGGLDETPLVERGAVKVTVAGPRPLLAMKLKASRGRRDLHDIEDLVGVCGIRSADEARALFEHYYRDDELSPRAEAALAAVFG
jgi:hypothetical protein